MTHALPLRIDSVSAQQRSARHARLIGYVAVLGAGLAIGLIGFGSRADPFALALAVLVCGAAAILVRPVLGVYLTLFFALVGDAVTMESYPFNRNFSSAESILYVHDALTFTPMEVYLAITALSWFVHAAGARSWRIAGRPLVGPLVGFAALVIVGLLWGVGVRGGNLTIAIWELRPILYLPVMYVLASNLLMSPRHYEYLAWVAVVAISVQHLFAISYFRGLGPDDRELLEGLTEHTASLQYGWLLLLALALCLLRGCSPVARVLVTLACIPTAYVFVLSQRRAAVVALAAAFPVFALILYFRQRQAFRVLVPVLVVLATGYTAVFWNATDGVGFGARAVKSVIASDQVSERDAASNLYRDIENYNLVYTVRSEPFTGVGFGQPFYQPVPMPDISFFVFYEYIPHNSIVWIWLKTGYLGFVALLFVIAATLRAGIRSALQIPSGNSLAVTVGALSYVVMYFVFAYVDIAWDTRSTLFLAVCMATCVNGLRVHQLDDESRRGGEPARR